MTHLIEYWQKPESVCAVQTSNQLSGGSDVNDCFDVHPHHSKPDMMAKLTKQFNSPHPLKFLKQVHKSSVHEFHQPPIKDFSIEADACFTRKPGIVCAVMTADCLPVLLTDVKGSFVAAVHCGWRSLFDDILTKTIEAINPSSQVLAWFGPCIQQSQYEVDEPFVENYLKKHPDCKTAFTNIVNGKSHASLYQLAGRQLQQTVDGQITYNQECTFLNQSYYSWRENKTTNRMASMIWIDAA